MVQMHEDKQLLMLKRIVKTMGIMLVVGTIMVISIAVGKMVGKAKFAKEQASCMYDEVIDTPVPGEVQDVQLVGNELLLVSRLDGNTTITIIDRCTGAITQRILLQSDE